MSRISKLADLLAITRGYTNELLDTIHAEDWFRQPTEGVTHIAWQVGHLAMAQYRLGLERVRGRQPEDAQLIPDAFLSLFSKGSMPNSDASVYPEALEIRRVFDGVYQRTLENLSSLTESILDEAVSPPHRMFDTKYGALLWCAHHEFIHAGQIGLLRRLFGGVPLR